MRPWNILTTNCQRFMFCPFWDRQVTMSHVWICIATPGIARDMQWFLLKLTTPVSACAPCAQHAKSGSCSGPKRVHGAFRRLSSLQSFAASDCRVWEEELLDIDCILLPNLSQVLFLIWVQGHKEIGNPMPLRLTAWYSDTENTCRWSAEVDSVIQVWHDSFFFFQYVFSCDCSTGSAMWKSSALFAACIAPWVNWCACLPQVFKAAIA